ncbi:MAG: hypothetical protein FJX31_04530 [Alphaproteobacteria bacterium]|nr:hypothetical protein [Alphaproteobacteria bacterium]
MVSGFNPYFLGTAFLVIVAAIFLFTRQWLRALPFGGSALVLFFLGMSRNIDNGDGNARR